MEGVVESKNRYQHRSLGMSRSWNSAQTEKRIITVVGEANSGKTCLTRCLVKKDVTACLEKHKTTLDESHYAITKMADGAHEHLQFIDTAPWQEFPVMHRLYVRTCHLVIIVYNVASKTWKESLMKMIKQVREIKDTVDIVVVGTHSDEMNMFMNFTPAHVREVIGNLPHVYISSVTGFGITKLWHTLLNTETALTQGHLANKPDMSSRLITKPSNGTLRKFAKKTSLLFCGSTKYQTL